MNRTTRTLCGAAALALCAASAKPAHAVQLSELLYDAVGTDNGTIFVELYGAPGTVLDGWHLEGVNGSDGAIAPIVTLSGAIPENGFFVVADSDAGATLVANADQLANFDFQNGPDSVVLRDALGNVLDAVGYGEFGLADVFAGEGSAAPDGLAGQSLARRFANLDTNDNAADFVLLDIPTPGTGALAAPEPGAALTLALSLAALALVRRRAPVSPSTV